MFRNLLGFLLILSLVAGCGRTKAGFDDDGGGPSDGSQTDASVCTPTCTEVCAQITGCGAQGIEACNALCASNPDTEPTLLCVKQQICAGTASCSKVKDCIANPKVPDLSFLAFSTTGGNSQLAYQARVCNNGTGASTATSLAFYRNRTTRPVLGQAGDDNQTIPALQPGGCYDVKGVQVGLAAGTYQSYAQIDPQGQVVEFDESNNVVGPSAAVVQGDDRRPNLSVQGFSHSLVGSAVTYLVEICNNGQVTSSSTSVEIYRNRNSAPTTSDAGDLEVSVPALAPGLCIKLDRTTTLPTGTYVSWAYVNRRGNSLEWTATDNIGGPLKFQVSTTTLPDLFVSSIGIAIELNDTVSYAIRVCNKTVGSGTTSATVALFYNRGSAPSTTSTPDQTLKVVVPADGCVNAVANAALLPGVYASWAYVDHAQLVKESDEGNNVFGPRQFSVQAASPDLVPVNFSTWIDGANRLNYAVTVCNQGPGGLPTTARIGFYHNRSSIPPIGTPPDVSTSISVLGPSSCRQRQVSVSGLAPGNYNAWVFVDYQAAILETNESNNVLGPRSFTIVTPGQPDLTVNGFGVRQASGAVYYRITICNQGTATAGGALTHLYYNRSSEPQPGDPADLTFSIVPLSAGRCTTRELQGKPPTGTVTSWVLVDATNVVAESNEKNNARSYRFTVTPPLPDLRFSDFRPVANPAGGVFYSATVCNSGQQSAAATDVAIFHNRSTPPPAGNGDLMISVPTLTAGSCTTVGAFANLPNGNYSAWARVDPNAGVAESNENNNVAGPVTFTIGSAQQCGTICKTLVSPCGMLPTNQFSACVAACASQAQSAIDCAEKAAQTAQCTQILQCLFAP